MAAVYKVEQDWPFEKLLRGNTGICELVENPAGRKVSILMNRRW